jgi:hypothetical protein
MGTKIKHYIYIFIKDLLGSRLFFFLKHSLLVYKKILNSLSYHVKVFLFLQKFDFCTHFLEFFDYKEEFILTGDLIF